MTNQANEGDSKADTTAENKAKDVRHERKGKSMLDVLMYICGALVVIGGLWLSYLGVFGHLNSQKVMGLWVLYGTLFFVLTGAFLYFQKQLGEQQPADTRADNRERTELHGLLIPANEPDPPNPCATNPTFKPPPDAVTIYYGGGATWITIPKHIVLKVKDTELLSISRTPEGVSISAQIYGIDGRIVAEIIDNEFRVNPNNYFRIVRTDSTLMVYDQYNKQTLNVRFLNPRAIKVTGIFNFAGRPPIVIGDNETRVGESALVGFCSANSSIGIALG